MLGTAGHIDHGKTALVRALTGVDTDRLPEEKARGITIVLGFAPLDLGGGLRLSVVDVPGHEGLVRTMVAGATGIDLVLLVVAADEGVMPQTREHVAICDLLGLARGVVALTKIDTVSQDVAALAAEEVRELLADSSLEGAPLLQVSALTGDGVPELRAALREAARGAPPATPRAGPPRLGIDRVFAMKGFGTVVTGTLTGAALRVGDNVEILPRGLRARIRGLESHGDAAEAIEPGQRCAVNLQGADREEIARGDVLSAPGALAPTTVLDARVRWLPGAPPLGEEAALELLVGTTDRRGRIVPIGADTIAPGTVGFARIHLEGAPVAVLPGDRFVLRGFQRSAHSGGTLGGGVVLDVAPPRRRRGDPVLRRDLELLARRDPATDLAVRIERSGLTGIARDALARECGLDAALFEAELTALAKQERVVAAGALWLGSAALREIEARSIAALEAWHRAEPLRPGLPRGALRGSLPENVAAEAAALALGRLAASGVVAIEGDLARLAGHAPRLAQREEEAAARIVEEARAAGLDPPAPREWAQRLGLAPERLRELLAHLARRGLLVRAPGDLYFHRAAVDALRERLVAQLRAHGSITTPDYKALIGTSRRSAVPLMELFDEERLTLRRGERRVLRGT